MKKETFLVNNQQKITVGNTTGENINSLKKKQGGIK
jgi:hypothetical protein